jgi:hypothetical protein
MPPHLRRCGLRLIFPATVPFWVVLSGLLLGLLSRPSAAQNTKGLAVVGNGSSSPTNSQMLIDATQFFVPNQVDMCGAIALACARLGTTNYPLGATIDARGFTGNQVCRANGITTMLSKCTPQGSSTNATGGKLLLGEVNLYADGPASGNYSDGLGSGVGTPALIIPSGFWGIEGLSRGANGSGAAQPGTSLSVCTGPNTPINASSAAPGSPPCSTAFPVRSFAIQSTNVSGNTMTITLPGPVTSGANIYLGELVMVKNSNVASNNGTYKVQTINNSVGTGNGSITVTVPSTTALCNAGFGCGTLFLGTPILGFGPGGGNMYNAPLPCPSNNPCAAFGMHIKNLGFNCQGDQGIDGCMGWQNLYAQEESGADTFLIDNYNFVGFDSHGNNAQNFGPIANVEILTGKGNANCTSGTTGAYIDGVAMRGFDNWTINSPAATGLPSPATCGKVPNAAVILDATDTEVRHGYCQGFNDCVLMGANNPSASGMRVTGIGDSNPLANVVHISANNSPSVTDFMVENIQSINGTPTVKDEINGVSLSSPFVSSYAWSKNATSGFTNLVTTDTTIPNRFPSGVSTGVAGKTDLAGQCVLGAGACSYSFKGSYANPPICTCTDVSPGMHACALTVTKTTITLAGNGTDTIDYICVSQN